MRKDSIPVSLIFDTVSKINWALTFILFTNKYHWANTPKKACYMYLMICTLQLERIKRDSCHSYLLDSFPNIVQFLLPLTASYFYHDWGTKVSSSVIRLQFLFWILILTALLGEKDKNIRREIYSAISD